jgi:hypothetical protein
MLTWAVPDINENHDGRTASGDKAASGDKDHDMIGV